jgi:hypothetical protein
MNQVFEQSADRLTFDPPRTLPMLLADGPYRAEQVEWVADRPGTGRLVFDTRASRRHTAAPIVQPGEPVNRRARPLRRQTSAALALLTIALLAGCGSDVEDQKTASESSRTSQRTQSPSVSPTESESTPATTATVRTPEPAVRFDMAMVRSVEVNKVNKGGQANVFVVADLTDPEALLEVARGCVKHYLGEQKAAFCHVWATEANFAARDPHGVGDLMCWTHYVGVPLAGGDPVVTTSKPYMLQIDGCPDPGV